MLIRFSLYGFLKNQRYFEPFFILFCLEKNFSYAEIGLLISIREISIFFLEIPTGAIADTFGRKKAMIFSFSAYIVSFLCYYYSNNFMSMTIASVLFALGEAFRTGTHKAMIFSWLKHSNRENEKTQIYGYTRSWSKYGSAVSIPIASLIVYFSANYNFIFFASTIPCFLNIINFISYPNYLDSEINLDSSFSKNTFSNAFKTFILSIKKSIINIKLRRILIESMNFEGLYKTTKDYIQPILYSFVLTIIIFPELDDSKKTAIVFGIVYFSLHLLSALASRFAGKFENFSGSQFKATKNLWLVYFLIYTFFAISLYFSLIYLQVISFVLLAIVQNLWRPILISRCSDLALPKERATILSIESQAKSIFAVFLAPVIGWTIDYLSQVQPILKFAPIALIGLIIPLIILLTFYKSKRSSLMRK